VGIATRAQDSVSVSANTITGRSDGLIMENDIDECVKKAKAKIEINKNCDIVHTLVIKKLIDDSLVYAELIGLKGHKIELKVLFIYEDKKNQKIIYDVFEKMGISLDQIVSGPFAESLIALNKKDMRLGACNLNVGLSNTSLVVYENNYPLLCTVIGGGGENATSDLSLGLRLSYSEAEEIKIGHSKNENGKRRVEEIIEARINYLNTKINDELKRIKRSELLPAGIILSGGSSQINKIDQYMRYDLKIPVSHVNKNISNNIHSNNSNKLDHENIRSYGIAMLYDESADSSIYFEYIKKIYSIIYGKIKKYLP
jgi:cell division protein FtsA